MGGLYQANWTKLNATSTAGSKFANFTGTSIDELMRQVGVLQTQYQGSAALKYVSEKIQGLQKHTQALQQTMTAHATAHTTAAEIAQATEQKNMGL